VVGRETASQPIDEVPVAEDGEVFIRQTGDSVLDDPTDASSLLV
jgi:hypothetical protein